MKMAMAALGSLLVAVSGDECQFMCEHSLVGCPPNSSFCDPQTGYCTNLVWVDDELLLASSGDAGVEIQCEEARGVFDRHASAYEVIGAEPGGAELVPLLRELELLVAELPDNEEFPLMVLETRNRFVFRASRHAGIYEAISAVLRRHGNSKHRILLAVFRIENIYLWRIQIASLVASLVNAYWILPPDAKRYAMSHIQLYTDFAALFGVARSHVVPDELADPEPLLGQRDVLNRASGLSIIQHLREAHGDVRTLLDVSRLPQNQLHENVRKIAIPQMMARVYPPELLLASYTGISVNQSHPLGEVLGHLARLGKMDLLAESFVVTYGDSAATGDGVTVDFLSSRLREAVDVSNGFFEYTDARHALIKPAEGYTDGAVVYRQIGRLIGLCVRHGVRPGVFFSKAVLSVLRDPLSIEMPSAAEQAAWLREDDPARFFSLQKLAEPGSDLSNLEFWDHSPVGTDNVTQFIEFEIEDVVVNSIKMQAFAIACGVYDVLPYPVWHWLSLEELGDLLGGDRSVDFALLHNSTSIHATPANAHIINWFWESVAGMTTDERADLIQFVSGSPYLPLSGIHDREWLQIVVDESAAADSLPRSQTCFTQLFLPVYSSRAVLNAQLSTAIAHCKSLELY